MVSGYAHVLVLLLVVISGARTNLKVGAHVRRKTPEICFVVPFPRFGSTAISRFGERFRDYQYSLVSFLFAVFLLTVPPCSTICKSGRRGHGPPWPMESTLLVVIVTLPSNWGEG